MGPVLDNLGVLGTGLAWTLVLACCAGAASLLGGVLLAVMRVSPVPAAVLIGSLYVGLVRNIPLAVLFFFTAFVLPQVGVSISYFAAAVLALSLYYAAFVCEVVRAGINAVARGQTEAARAIGLPFGDVLTSIVLPQAFRTIVPPLANVAVALVKNTAVAAAFGVPELLTAMQDLANRESTAVIPILVTTGLLYLAITVPMGLLARHVEGRLAFAR